MSKRYNILLIIWFNIFDIFFRLRFFDVIKYIISFRISHFQRINDVFHCTSCPSSAIDLWFASQMYLSLFSIGFPSIWFRYEWQFNLNLRESGHDSRRCKCTGNLVSIPSQSNAYGSQNSSIISDNTICVSVTVKTI